MPKQQIIIYTNKFDPHADYMIRKLKDLGSEPIRLNTDDIPCSVTTTWKIDNQNSSGVIANTINSRVINFDEIRSIWVRRPEAFKLPDDLSEQELAFAKSEAEHIYNGILTGIDSYWVSYPPFIRVASLKPGQLKRASQMGLDIPRTIISNNPAEVSDFFSSCRGKVIYKVMTDPFLSLSKFPTLATQPSATFTTLMTESDLQQIDSFLPGMFQELIPKKLELRITVVGNEIFTVEIHSQNDVRTSVDWRHYHVDIPYKKGTLPLDIAEKCLALVRSYNLNYSALDFILTPDGRYVFLENNPNGQFAFLEELVPELKISDALAANLIRGSS